jgi:hypothetical protein
MQAIETQLNRRLPTLPESHRYFLATNGYLVGDKISLSPRFSAITGGNTIKGNYFHKVWDTARKVGVIPESDLPSFGGTTNWAEYHDPTVITKDMEKKAARFLEFFEIKYDFIGYDQIKGFSEDEARATDILIKQCPIGIGVPIPVSHAILMLRRYDQKYDSFDHYTPCHRVNDPRGVGLAMRGVVTIKETPVIKKPVHFFAVDLAFGDKGIEVAQLQLALIFLGFLKPGLDTGYFGPITKNAVIKLQESRPVEILKKAGITHGTGLVRSVTRAYLNSLFQK